MDDKTVIRFPNDNTVIRPRPGGKRKAFSNNPGRQISPSRVSSRGGYSGPARDIMAEFHAEQNSDTYLSQDQVNDLNDLVHCSSTVLSLMIKLSNTVMHKEVNQLKYKLQDEIKQFEICAGRAGISNDKILQARYVICTSMDEIVANTPWGQESDWSQHSLLSIFHGETWGGEKFFLLLERLLKEPIKNLDILELMYICMSLGFQGKFRVIDNGQAEVEHLREDLFRQLRSLKKDFNKELSCQWRGISDARGALIRYVPLWVVGAILGVILLALFSSFTYMLDQSSTPVMNEIIKLGSIKESQPVQEPLNDKLDAEQPFERLVRPPQKTTQTSANDISYNVSCNSLYKPVYGIQEQQTSVLPGSLSIRGLSETGRIV